MNNPSGTSMFSFIIMSTVLLIAVHGHGMICDPRQRAAYTSSRCGTNLPFPSHPVDNCPHCLSGGTVANVTKNLPPSGWHLYDPIADFDRSATRAELCGDQLGHPDHMIGGKLMPPSQKNVPIVQVYKAGSDIDFQAAIDTNHNGYFEFFLCNLDECGVSDIHGKCFKNGHCHRLIRVPHKECEDKQEDTVYECGPIDIEYPGRWYLPCRIDGLQIVGGGSRKMRYKLPSGVNCRHCVIQWYWATSNSCAPKGVLNYMRRENNPFGTKCESDGGGVGTFRGDMGPCGGQHVPEEFWSCSDVQITSDGRRAGIVKAVPLEETTQKTKSDIFKKPIVGEDEETSKQRAENGDCLEVGRPCDGGVPCCKVDAVCVHTTLQAGFSCAYWWDLYKEVEYREAQMEKKRT